MHCAVHEIMGSQNQTGKKGVNLAKKGVKIEFSKKIYRIYRWDGGKWYFSFEPFISYSGKYSVHLCL